MTSDQQRQFEHMWPALALRLQRMLRRKKVAPWLQEDVVQETGLRLIRMWEHVDQTKPLWPLTATIGLNLLRDEMRKASWSELVQAVPDGPSVENVERRGMARLELRAVGRSLKRMPASHRDVLLAEMSDELMKSPDPSATRMLRMRARRKLQHLMDQASMLGIALGAQLRRMIRETEILLTRTLPERAEGVTTAAVGLVAALSMGMVMSPDGLRSPATGGALPDAGRGAETAARAAGEVLDAVGGAQRGSRQPGRNGGRWTEVRSDRDGSDGSRDDVEGDGQTGGESKPFPGARSYRIELTDDTYVHGEFEVEVVGGTDIHRAKDGQSPEPGSVDCTVAPGDATGASCTHSGEESGSRGVRANHSGHAYVAGKRVY
ncbi:MAG TPA: sigma-70 family RNA polymerase sigma factor [Actinomycetota bacterium]|nr:sigma-70 family RNA polymerase sigma factor [Actinomycetota bacterium]